MAWGNPEDRRIEGFYIKGDCNNIKMLLEQENIRLDNKLTNRNMRIDVYENTLPLLEDIIMREEENKIDFTEDKLSYFTPEFICIINPDVDKLNNILAMNTKGLRLSSIFCFEDIESCKAFIYWWYMRFTVEFVWMDCDYSLPELMTKYNEIKLIHSYSFDEVIKNHSLYTNDFFVVSYYKEESISRFLEINECERVVEKIIEDRNKKEMQCNYYIESTYQVQYPTFKRVFFGRRVG